MTGLFGLPRFAKGFGYPHKQQSGATGLPATPTIGFSPASLTQAEGNAGTTNFVFTVVRTGPTTGTSSANWAVTGSGANPANAADFVGGVLPSGTVNFAIGDTSKTITVPVSGDTTPENDETFTVTLSSPVGANLGVATAVGTITNDDLPVLDFSPTSVSQAEGNTGTTNFVFTVTRSGPTTGTSSANWAVTGSGANPANAADFVGAAFPSGTVNFAIGDTSKTITVPVAGDTTVETDETFTVTLSSPSGATLGVSTATGTITNYDSSGASTGLQVLMNSGDLSGYAMTGVFGDMMKTSGPQWIPSAFGSPVTDIPKANYNANQWPDPTNPPAAGAYYLIALYLIEGETYDWTFPAPGVVDDWFIGAGATQVSVDTTSNPRKLRFTCNGSSGNQQIVQLKWKPNATNPSDFMEVRCVGDSGLVRSRAFGELSAFAGYRYLGHHRLTTEYNSANQAPWGGGADQAHPVYLVTWAGRSKQGGANQGIWSGTDIESDVAMANAMYANGNKNKVFKHAFPLNCDDAFITNTCAYIRDNLNTNIDVEITRANECWNTGYDSWHQLANEAVALGLPDYGHGMSGQALARYAQKLVDMEALARPVFATDARPARLQVVAETQGAVTWTTQTVVDHLTSIGKLSKINGGRVATYWKGGTSTSYVNPTGPHTALFAAAEASQESTLNDYDAHCAIWTAAGWTCGTYEGGQHELISDGPTMINVQQDPLMVQLVYRWAQEHERRGTSHRVLFYCHEMNADPTGSYALGLFGARSKWNEDINHANSKKMKALIAFNAGGAGSRMLQPLLLDPAASVEVNPPNDTLIATITKRRVIGSTFTLTNSDGGRVRMVDTGTVVQFWTDDESLINATGTRTFGWTESDPRDTANGGSLAGTGNYVVIPAMPKITAGVPAIPGMWTSGLGMACHTNSGGMSVTQPGDGAIHLISDGTTNRGISYYSTAVNFTNKTRCWMTLGGTTGSEAGVTIGLPGSGASDGTHKLFLFEQNDGSLKTIHYNGSTFVAPVSSDTSYTLATHPHIQLRWDATNLFIEVKVAADDPTLSTGWTLVRTLPLSGLSYLDFTNMCIGFTHRNEFGNVASGLLVKELHFV